MPFQLPKTPLKYVLPGVIGFTRNSDGSKKVHDIIHVHPSYWLTEATKNDDTELIARIKDYDSNHCHGGYTNPLSDCVCSTVVGGYKVVRYDGDLPHTYKPLYVISLDVKEKLHCIASLYPEGGIIRDNAMRMLERLGDSSGEIYKDDPSLVNAYLDSNLYIDTHVPGKDWRSYKARMELQKLLTAEVIGDTHA